MNRERFEQMAQMRADGKNDREISEAFGGISRERVRQILVSVPRPVRRRRERAVRPTHPCSVCGAPVRQWRQTEHTRLHLCAEHSVLRSALWRLIDETYFNRHRQLVQRGSGRTDPTYGGIWKQRERRWLNRGSTVHTALLGAYLQGAAIVEMLPPVIQAQLAQDAKRLTTVGEEAESDV